MNSFMKCLNILIIFLFRMKQKYHDTNKEAILIFKKVVIRYSHDLLQSTVRRNFTAIREHSEYLIIEVIN